MGEGLRPRRMTEPTPMSSVSRLEVITTGARRRWTLEEKRRIVAESYRAPRIGSETAGGHGLNPIQLSTWRRLDSEGRLTTDADELTFVPAIVADERPATPRTSGPACLPAAPEAVTASSGAVARGVMEIVLAGGC